MKWHDVENVCVSAVIEYEMNSINGKEHQVQVYSQFFSSSSVYRLSPFYFRASYFNFVVAISANVN